MVNEQVVRIGLLGCGNVGAAVARLVHDHGDDIALRTGCRLQITRVAVRDVGRDRDVPLSPEVFTTDGVSIVDDPDIDIVCELLGGVEPARALILRAFANGKAVVTASKELLANNGKELFDASDAAGVDLAFEAAVAGGIPLIAPLKGSLTGERISRILGIVNGTTNYILTQMSEHGSAFDDALADAQRLGYAEADPTADVEGFDAAAKCAILASIAFNTRVVASDVYREGITKIQAQDIADAKRLGYTVKLLAIAELDDGEVSVRVHPAMVPESHPLASVRDAFNAVFVEGDRIGQLMFYGRGAGGDPTAVAVVGDLAQVARNRVAGTRGIGCTCVYERRIRPMDDTHGQFYLNLHVEDGPGVLAEIADHFGAQRRVDRACVAGGVRRRGHARVHHAPHAGERVPEDAATAARAPGRAGDRQRPARGGGRGMTADGAHQWRGVIQEYRARLPVSDETPIVTLCEGGTPLVRSDPLSDETGCDVWLKYEGANPTGSFKDRGMTLAISKAMEEGAKAVVCASTGNTSASAAAYAAKAGITCAVLVPKGKIALGKMAQTLVHGARVLEVDGNFDAALELAKGLAERYPVTLVNSVNPFRIEGQKTAAFEICDRLGRAPDIHCVPVGNAGNISSHWLGYSEYLRDGVIAEPPQLFGFQAQGAAPIVRGEAVKDPQTIATAIRIGNPASWDKAVAAATQSEGQILAVTDREILASYRRVAREGLFAEPASAASVAGLLHLHADGKLPRGATVVCVLTGHGLKDPEWAIAGASQPATVPAGPRGRRRGARALTS